MCATTDGSFDSARCLSIQSLHAYAISTKSNALAQIIIINRVSKETIVLQDEETTADYVSR